MGRRTRRDTAPEQRSSVPETAPRGGYAAPAGVTVSDPTIPFTPAAGQPSSDGEADSPSAWRQIKDRHHRHRYTLKPWMFLSGLPTFAETMHLIPSGPVIKIGVPLLAAVALTVAQWRHRKPGAERTYALACIGYGAAWTAWAVVAGVFSGFTLLAFLPGWLIGAILWWDRHMIRAPKTAPSDSRPVTDPFVAQWDEEIGCPGGPMPGSRLSRPEEVLSGRSFHLKLARGKTIEDAEMARKAVASTLGMSRKRLLFEPLPSEDVPGDTDDESEIRLILLSKQNPQQREDQPWTGPTLDMATGLYDHAVFPDGTRAKARLFTTERGTPWRACNSLFSGTTGSGKSRGVALKALEQKASGIFVTWFADGQDGVSIPELRGQVDWYGDSHEKALRMLRAAFKLMKGRIRGQRGRGWTDSLGNTRTGLGHWEATPEDPFVQIMLDEAQEILRDPVAVKIIKALLRMGNKVGIGLDLITQVPILNELGAESGDGGAQVIRGMAKSGNLVMYRAEESSTKTAVVANGVIVDPQQLPHASGMCYLLNEHQSRSTHARTFYVTEDELWSLLDMIDALPLDPPSAEAAGEDYANRHAAAAGDSGDDDGDLDAELSILLGERLPGQDAPGSSQEKLTIKNHVFEAVRKNGGPMKREDILAAVTAAMGRRPSDSAINQALKWWGERGHLEPTADHGFYDLVGRDEMADAADNVTPIGR